MLVVGITIGLAAKVGAPCIMVDRSWRGRRGPCRYHFSQVDDVLGVMLAEHTRQHNQRMHVYCGRGLNTYREDRERLVLALTTRLVQRHGDSSIVESGLDAQRGLAKQLEGVPVNVCTAELLGHGLGYLLAKQREPVVGASSRRRGRGRHDGQGRTGP